MRGRAQRALRTAVLALLDGKGTVLTWHPERGARRQLAGRRRAAPPGAGETGWQRRHVGRIRRCGAQVWWPPRPTGNNTPARILHVLIGVSQGELTMAAERRQKQAGHRRHRPRCSPSRRRVGARGGRHPPSDPAQIMDTARVPDPGDMRAHRHAPRARRTGLADAFSGCHRRRAGTVQRRAGRRVAERTAQL